MSVSRRLTAQGLEKIRAELADRWPLIGWWLRVERGEVHFDYFGWDSSVKHHGVHGEELAAAYDQQIAYYQWRLEQRQAGRLAGDRVGRHLSAKWTDSITYCSRRQAAIARGDDPGEWVDQHVRRPDLAAESEAIVEEIMAEHDTHDECDRHLAAVS